MKNEQFSALIRLARRTAVLCLFFALASASVALAERESNFTTKDLLKVIVRGRVIDNNGVAMPGVGVSLKGTQIRVTTDANGTYSLDAPAAGVLVFTFVGFTTQELSAGNNTVLNVTLTPETTTLEEVVVVGYGQQTKATMTGAVSSVKSEALLRTPSSTTSGALVGKIAGITARAADSRPGSSTSIQIRNYGTPLFIIDGVPMTQADFNNLDLSSIEDISVLKDASAAIYGLRAANGVVLVTTKKGSVTGKSVINVSSYYGSQSFSRYVIPANAYLYVTALNYAEQNNSTQNNITPALPYSQAELEKWKAGTEKGYQNTNYYDYIMSQNVPQYYLNASASGGYENVNYNISIGHVYQNATIKDNYFKRTNLQANLDIGLAKGFKVGTQISGRLETRHEVSPVGSGASTYDNPFLAILSMWPTERAFANDNPLYINADVNIPTRNPELYKESVVGSQEQTNTTFNGNFYAQYQFPFGLTAKATYSYGFKPTRFENQRKIFSTYRYVAATDTYTEVVTGTPPRVKRRDETQNFFSQLQLNYSKNLGSHSIKATAAYESERSETQNLQVNSISPNNYSPLIRYIDVNGVTDTYGTSERASFIGRADYSFKQKYLVTLLGRYDGSYLYAPGKRWGLFPGVQLAWRVSEEPFFKENLSFFSNFKLRASYGQTGIESGVNQWDYLGGASYGSGSYIFDGTLATGVDPRDPAVTNITWATNIQKNIGFDFGLFNNKFAGQFDVFARIQKNLTGTNTAVIVPSEIGYSLPEENLKISNGIFGIEGQFSYTSKINNVDYSIGLNATLSREKSLDRYRQRWSNSYDQWRNGTQDRWSNILFGFETEGQFTSLEQIRDWPVNIDGSGNRTLLPGDIIYKDTNGDKIINNNDQLPIGYARGANPYMSFGLNTEVGYKGFKLTLDFAGGSMQSLVRELELRVPFQANHSAPHYIFDDVWHRADVFDDNSPWIPGKYPPIRKNPTSQSSYNKISSFWLTNVKYIRLKSLELGYDIPQKFIQKAGASRLRVYANGSNLFSIDNMKEYEADPEISMGSGLVYPNVKLYTFGFNLTF